MELRRGKGNREIWKGKGGREERNGRENERKSREYGVGMERDKMGNCGKEKRERDKKEKRRRKGRKRKERVEKWARRGKYTIVDNEIWEVI